jgi:hypothetical protein
VVHLENLDVESLVEGLGHTLGKRGKQINTETHIA